MALLHSLASSPRSHHSYRRIANPARLTSFALHFTTKRSAAPWGGIGLEGAGRREQPPPELGAEGAGAKLRRTGEFTHAPFGSAIRRPPTAEGVRSCLHQSSILVSPPTFPSLTTRIRASTSPFRSGLRPTLVRPGRSSGAPASSLTLPSDPRSAGRRRRKGYDPVFTSLPSLSALRLSPV